MAQNEESLFDKVKEQLENSGRYGKLQKENSGMYAPDGKLKAVEDALNAKLNPQKPKPEAPKETPLEAVVEAVVETTTTQE